MLIKKEKLIDKALKDTEADIQAFQTEKQGKLNELLRGRHAADVAGAPPGSRACCPPI